LDYKPLNLGQGFPDFAAPLHVCKALSDAVMSENVLLNQYTRGFVRILNNLHKLLIRNPNNIYITSLTNIKLKGHPRLVNSLSKLYSKLINRDINGQKEILVTSGAYEALFCTFMSLVNPGDEVIIIEPFFDCYEPMTLMAGGIPVFIPLRPKQVNGRALTSKDWVLDPIELESKFSSKTKLIIVNTPHNPLGKVRTLKRDFLHSIKS